MYYSVVFLTGVCHPNSFNRAQGAYRLASQLRYLGIPTRVIDGVGSLDISYIKNMVEVSVTSQTKLFCISSSFFSNFNTSVHSDSLVTTNYLPYERDEWLSLMMTVKKLSPDIRIVVGGHKANEFYRDPISQLYIDSYVYGYSDNTIHTLLEDSHIEIANGRNLSTSEFNNLITRYDHKDSFLHGESFTVEMQRGCMFRCSFCAYPLNGKRRGDYTKQISIFVDELQHCHDMFGSSNFIINSDTFNDDEEYVASLAEELAVRNLQFNFAVNARADVMYRKPNLIQSVKDCGVRTILFGLETSNPFTLKNIGKGLEFSKVKDTLYQCKEIWGDRIKMTGSYIVGLPNDTESNLQTIYDFFTSESCPLHSIEFDPLYVFNKELDTNIWQSDYTLNPGAHGFSFNGDLMEWSNEKTPFKTFSETVKKTNDYLSTFPITHKGTIKSAAYAHLPNNIYHNRVSSRDRFEEVFQFRTYKEYNAHLIKNGTSILQAKSESAKLYYETFMVNNS